MDNKPFGYVQSFDADEQIAAEERIAALIRAHVEDSEDANGGKDWQLSDEDCADLGREILLQVLAEFRPDLIERK
jgi:hypothetical protein